MVGPYEKCGGRLSGAASRVGAAVHLFRVRCSARAGSFSACGDIILCQVPCVVDG